MSRHIEFGPDGLAHGQGLYVPTGSQRLNDEQPAPELVVRVGLPGDGQPFTPRIGYGDPEVLATECDVDPEEPVPQTPVQHGVAAELTGHEGGVTGEFGMPPVGDERGDAPAGQGTLRGYGGS